MLSLFFLCQCMCSNQGALSYRLHIYLQIDLFWRNLLNKTYHPRCMHELLIFVVSVLSMPDLCSNWYPFSHSSHMSRGGGGHTVLELCVTSGKMFVLELVTAVLYATLGTVILEDNLLLTAAAKECVITSTLYRSLQVGLFHSHIFPCCFFMLHRSQQSTVCITLIVSKTHLHN